MTLTPELARELGEREGQFALAESRLKQWPAQNDEKVVENATAYIFAREAFKQTLKKCRREVFAS